MWVWYKIFCTSSLHLSVAFNALLSQLGTCYVKVQAAVKSRDTEAVDIFELQ